MLAAMKNTEKFVSITFRLPRTLLKKLRSVAKKSGTTQSELLRTAINDIIHPEQA